MAWKAFKEVKEKIASVPCLDHFRPDLLNSLQMRRLMDWVVY